MMHDQMIRRRKAVAIAVLGAAFSVACAGTDIPDVDPELRGGLETAYTGTGPVAAAGTGGAAAGGSGGASGSSGAGGRASGSGGSSASEGGAAGSAPGEAGAAGSAMETGNGGSSDGAAGASMSAAGAAGAGPSAPACDGFAILEANCGTAGCHGAGSNLGNFAESETIARTFVGRNGAVCSSQGFLIDPEDPPASLLILKLSDDPPCGQPMPAGGQLLADSDIDCIEDWIGSLE